MTRRPRIWCGFANKGTLDAARGDSIGEMRILKMLSCFADVYYNGVAVDRDCLCFGAGEQLTLPRDEFDLYYVRANNALFAQLPHPKICMAYPYDEEIFAMADGLVVTTDIWKHLLLTPARRPPFAEFFAKWYPDTFHTAKPIVQFKQAIDPSFAAIAASDQQRSAWRFKLTNTDVFGFYGRLDKSSLPYSIMQAAQSDSRVLLAFAGRIRSDLKAEQDIIARHVYLGQVPYQQMPQLIAATACTLAGESCDDDVLGSNKVLDSIGLGVPVICKRNPVRDEYLGADYLGLFDDTAHAAALLGAFLGDRKWRETLLAQTRAAATRNALADAAAYTAAEIESLFKAIGAR
ncbi:MAG: glycosyltransferase [Gammaproteobacteria bacterium]|nr:glycosyltransferase [Gammaproteobacteria bacterium]